MKKIVIVGISGTGKSTFARALHEKTGMPLFHMDSIIWNKNWQETSSKEIGGRLNEIARKDAWIVEGWLDTYSERLLADAHVIFYLDYPGYLAAWGGLMRWVKHRGGKRPELPQGCNESFNLAFLKAIFLRQERPHIEAMLSKIDSKKIVRLRSWWDGEQLIG